MSSGWQVAEARDYELPTLCWGKQESWRDCWVTEASHGERITAVKLSVGVSVTPRVPPEWSYWDVSVTFCQFDWAPYRLLLESATQVKF